ncbi:hypothetical protein [Micromonospora arborensis]|nr:hypothetical protein [Micromonospora arborensis]
MLSGLIFTRYLNPIGALSPADVRQLFGPALRAALHGRPRRA